MERVMGIEPTSKAWEAFVLPLNHTRAAASVYDSLPPGNNCARAGLALFGQEAPGLAAGIRAGFVRVVG